MEHEPEGLPLIRWLLQSSGSSLEPPPDPPDVTTWWTTVRPVLERWSASVDRAVVSGFLSARVAYAFAGGLQSGLRALVPGLPAEPLVCLCITEEGGGHPRAIQARLTPIDAGDGDPPAFLLSGRKKFVTLGCEARLLLVAASLGVDAAGRNQLRLVRVSPDAPGVTLEPMGALPVVPEISHAVVRLEEVRIDSAALAPGDAYVRYIKPFRTVEDTHVSAGLLGNLLRVGATAGWPDPVIEELIGLVVMLRGIATADPAAAEVHIALAGYFQAQERVFEALEPHWSRVDPEVRGRWERDAALRLIAGKVRARRREAAWEAFGRGGDDG